MEKVIGWRVATTAICLGLANRRALNGDSQRTLFLAFSQRSRVIGSMPDLEMPEGTPATTTLEAADGLERAAGVVNKQLTQELDLAAPLVRHTFVSVGKRSQRSGPGDGFGGLSSNIAEVVVDLAPIAERGNISSKIFANRWREAVAGIPDAVNLTFDADKFGSGAPLEYQMRGDDVDELRRAAEEIKGELSKFNGVFDISDSWRMGKQEIQLEFAAGGEKLRPHAQ